MAADGKEQRMVEAAGVHQVRGLTQVPRFFKVAALAARLGVLPKTVRDWHDDGEFPGAIQPKGVLLIPESDAMAFIERHKTARKGA